MVKRGILVALFLIPVAAQAQQIVLVKCHDGTSSFFCGDAANTALRVNVVASVGGGGAVTQGAGFGAATGYWNTRLTDGTSFYVAMTDTQLRATPVDVNCASGCVAGGSFADSAAFTFGTTAVGLSAFVVDDTATNTVAENSAGAARMSANRVLYVDLSKTTANATAVKVDGSAVTQPVSIAAAVAVTGPLTDVQLRATPVPVSGTVTTSPPANASTNVAQFGGTNVSTGTGAGGVGIPRVTVSNDSSLAANQSINLNQVAGVGTAVGNGTAAGSIRVTLPTDGTGVIASITTSVVPGTGATNLGKAEDVAHTTADTGVFVFAVSNPAATVLTSASGDYSPFSVDQYGAVYTAPHPNRFSCFVPLTATVMTQCQAAPAAGLRAYVVSMSCSNGAATVQGVDVVFGTGANCATAPTAMTHKYQMGTLALTTSPFLIQVSYDSPLVPTAANAICVRPTAATAFGCTLTGLIAP